MLISFATPFKLSLLVGDVGTLATLPERRASVAFSEAVTAETNDELALTKAVCFVEIRVDARAVDLVLSRPPLIKVEIRLALHDEQVVVHLEKQGSSAAMLMLVDALVSPEAVIAADAAALVAAVLLAKAFCLEAIKEVAKAEAVALVTPELIKVLVKLEVHALQPVVHLEKQGSTFATARLLVAFANPTDARVDVASALSVAVSLA